LVERIVEGDIEPNVVEFYVDSAQLIVEFDECLLWVDVEIVDLDVR